MNNVKWLSFFLIIVVLTSGCAHLSSEKKYEKLEATQKLYWKSLRWKSYEGAARVIRFRNPARQLASIENLNRITLTNYEEGASVSTGEDDVYVTDVIFSYVQNETGRLLQVKHRETWWYDEETKSWYLDSDMPDFKFD